MKKLFFLLIIVCACSISYCQRTLTLIIKDSTTKEAISGTTVTSTILNKAVIPNSNGYVSLKNIITGKHSFTFSSIGYTTKTIDILLALQDSIEIFLSSIDNHLDEIIIQSTRTSRSIYNTPTRVETIDAEELDEKNNMRPANVSMLLHESTGLQVQQTSATSGNASIRVQGLDGRYTQLLKDGYPNFGNFANGLSILEIPPLDLQQVEVIKGPASTLYGGGAIAGVVDFITKKPKEKAEYNFLINQSNIGQTNIGAYASQKKGKLGYTFLAAANFQKAYDVDKDNFSELPANNNFTINPCFFYYPNNNTSLMIGNNFLKSNSKGGDMSVINGHADNDHVYFEENNSVRNTTTFEFDKKYQNKNSMKIKQSLSFFDRKISTPNYFFWGKNTNSFTDISYIFTKTKHTIIAGVNFVSDRFKQQATLNDQNTTSFTSGIYAQDTWDITKSVKIEWGIRLDNVQYKNIYYNKQQTFALPHISALFKLYNKISSRIGGGLGYKTPTIFTEQTEAMQYQNILPLNNVTAEKSIGGTADINYKTNIATDLFFSINQLFFYTEINTPLILQSNFSGKFFFENTIRPIQSKGFETNIKLIYKKDLKLFAGYTYTNAKATYLTGNQYLPLLPKSKLNLTLMFEKEDNFKIGLEGYFTRKQYLYNGSQTPSFWEFGAMAQKTIKKITIFINLENFTDQRQSKYKTVVNPPYDTPRFDDIWNHTEGFAVNGGMKIKL